MKTMLIAFFDNEGTIHKEFVFPGETFNAVFYEEVFKRLLRRIHRVWQNLHASGKWVLLNDNASVHAAIRTIFANSFLNAM